MNINFSKNEDKRLEALRRYNILDSAPEQSFDAITTLAARVCGADVALITFLDKDRQWFKSKVGLETDETPRNIAFCNTTIQNKDVFIVEDASTHPDFRKNPLVTGEPGIRFYAGAPLIDSEGNALGAVCVIGFEPRTINQEQKQSLQDLSKVTMELLETRYVAGQLAEVTSELKTLQGFIPICANCKSIRNDSDEWKEMEQYIQKHTDAKFSHSICPECSKELYPEFQDQS